MAYRKRTSRKGSRKTWAKGNKVKGKNWKHLPPRGGWRL